MTTAAKLISLKGFGDEISQRTPQQAAARQYEQWFHALPMLTRCCSTGETASPFSVDDATHLSTLGRELYLVSDAVSPAAAADIGIDKVEQFFATVVGPKVSQLLTTISTASITAMTASIDAIKKLVSTGLASDASAAAASTMELDAPLASLRSTAVSPIDEQRCTLLECIVKATREASRCALIKDDVFAPAMTTAVLDLDKATKSLASVADTGGLSAGVFDAWHFSKGDVTAITTLCETALTNTLGRWATALVDTAAHAIDAAPSQAAVDDASLVNNPATQVIILGNPRKDELVTVYKQLNNQLAIVKSNHRLGVAMPPDLRAIYKEAVVAKSRCRVAIAVDYCLDTIVNSPPQPDAEAVRAFASDIKRQLDARGVTLPSALGEFVQQMSEFSGGTTGLSVGGSPWPPVVSVQPEQPVAAPNGAAAAAPAAEAAAAAA